MIIGDLIQRVRRRWSTRRKSRVTVAAPFSPATIPPATVPEAPGRLTLPRTRSEIAQAAAALDLTIVDACMPGVVANLVLLDGHAAILFDRMPGTTP